MSEVPGFALQCSAFDVRGIHESFLKREIAKARAMIDCSLTEFSIVLVGDKRMSALHEQFLKVKGPTDVLSFPMECDGEGKVVAGEVVICLPEARRQAKARAIELRLELLLYAIHGLLHLCDFDDRTDSDYRLMHGMERAMMRKLGFAPVFSAKVVRGTTRLKQQSRKKAV